MVIYVFVTMQVLVGKEKMNEELLLKALLLKDNIPQGPPELFFTKEQLKLFIDYLPTGVKINIIPDTFIEE